jgi:LAS superfamily LD-carboxypeptidase LdcB
MSTLMPTSANAKTSTDPRKARQEVRAKRAKAAAKIDTLKASSKDVNAALDALEDNVTEAVGDYGQARRDAITAAADAADARAAEAAKVAELEALRVLMRDVGLRAYSDAAEDSSGGFSMLVDDPGVNLLRAGYSDLYSLTAGDAADQMRQDTQDLALIRTQAEEAEVLAAQRKEEEESQLDEVRQREDEQQSLADRLETRLERALGEANNLAQLDSTLSAQIAKQDELAARLARTRRGSAGGRAGATISSAGTSMVRGIRVASSIAGSVDRMVAAAADAGLSLGGGGWRDPASQVALRRSNCGGSSYAVYSKPASSCRPPTARPGASMHERGLAIDFTCSGALISSRSNTCYRWLKAHAGAYGFHNLPSEPWHWSTTGQ